MLKKPLEKIRQELVAAKKIIAPGTKYCHHKNSTVYYTIINLTTSVHTQEPMIHYTDGKNEWSRDIESFTSLVAKDGKEVARFKEVEGL